MTPNEQRYWFPAKRYGWGWGVPRTWEGWTVVLAFLVVVLLAAVVGQGATWTLPVVLAATLVLLVICLMKGEPTKWRWGGAK